MVAGAPPFDAAAAALSDLRTMRAARGARRGGCLCGSVWDILCELTKGSRVPEVRSGGLTDFEAWISTIGAEFSWRGPSWDR